MMVVVVMTTFDEVDDYIPLLRGKQKDGSIVLSKMIAILASLYIEQVSK